MRIASGRAYERFPYSQFHGDNMPVKTFNQMTVEAAARHAAFDTALTVDEVSARWRVSNVLVRRLIGTGALKSFRVGRCVRILTSSVILAESGDALESVPVKVDASGRAERKTAGAVEVSRPRDLTALARVAQAALGRSVSKPRRQ